jgi:hypothetical protein
MVSKFTCRADIAAERRATDLEFGAQIGGPVATEPKVRFAHTRPETQAGDFRRLIDARDDVRCGSNPKRAEVDCTIVH